MNKKKRPHEPVLAHEVTQNLHIKKNAQYIDATLGAAGHTVEIIKAGGVVLGIDDDAAMLEIAREQVSDACLSLNRDIEGCFKVAHGNFRNISSIAKENAFTDVAGILLDLGLSSVHYDTDDRGFSFDDLGAPLDMRLDPDTQNVAAKDLLNALDSSQLTELFSQVLGRSKAHQIVKQIVEFRDSKPFATVGDFVEVSSKVMPAGKINPATKPFMALRMAVNTELENLRLCLPQAFGLLQLGGILEVISFHSLEDRIVKKYFQKKQQGGDAEIVTKKPIVAGKQERQKNPRARSAKLRILKKL